jgi:hypothetical protein
MKKPSDPTLKLAKRVLAEVDFDDRLFGFKLKLRSGPTPVTMYSFPEVVAFLRDDNPRIDIAGLQIWVKDVMGDRELAGIIDKAIDEDDTDYKKTEIVRELMEIRLDQCKRLVKKKVEI